MDSIIFFCVCVINGLVGYAIGQRAGRGLAGILWGVLLGPIGWVVILIAGGSGPKCPRCQGVLPSAEVRACKHCGAIIASKGAKSKKAEKIRQQWAARDPLEEWEAQERMKAGPPAAPEHLKGKSWDEE